MNNRVLYDYVTFTVKDYDFFSIVDFLGFDVSIFRFLENKGRYFYKNRFEYDKCINIYCDGINEDMGVCVEMSGDGCRAFETLGNGDYQSIFDLILDGWNENPNNRRANITRLDIAYDDFNGVLDLKYLLMATQNRDYASRFKDWNVNTGSKGSTVEHGAKRASSAYIRIYDKLLEQTRVRKKSIDPDIIHWVRAEIQLRDDCARGFIKLDGDVRSNYFNVLNNYLRYVIPSENTTNKSMVPTSPEWLNFIETWETKSIFDKPGMNYNLANLDNLVFNQMGGAVSTMIDVMGVDEFVNELSQRRKGKPLNPKYRDIKQHSEKSDGIADYLNERKKHSDEMKKHCSEVHKSSGDPKVDEFLKGLGIV